MWLQRFPFLQVAAALQAWSCSVRPVLAPFQVHSSVSGIAVEHRGQTESGGSSCIYEGLPTLAAAVVGIISLKTVPSHEPEQSELRLRIWYES